MPKKKISANIKIDNDVFNVLDATASRLRHAVREGELPSRGRGKSWGAGTVAAYLVERIVREQPKLLEDWFDVNVLASFLEGEDFDTKTMSDSSRSSSLQSKKIHPTNKPKQRRAQKRAACARGRTRDAHRQSCVR